MWRTLPWILSAVLLIAFGASFSELQRVRKRFGEVTRHAFHDHQDLRQFEIRAALADAERPIVVIGDSITEMAPLPREITGHPVVNSGIRGLRTSEFIPLAPHIFRDKKPFAIAIALGANDIGSTRQREDLSELISLLKQWTPRLVIVSVTSDQAINGQISAAAQAAGIPFFDIPIPDQLKMSDHIHFTAAAYREWIPRLRSAIENIISKD
jgi:lysophospholipase L1-like esterase